MTLSWSYSQTQWHVFFLFIFYHSYQQRRSIKSTLPLWQSFFWVDCIMFKAKQTHMLTHTHTAEYDTRFSLAITSACKGKGDLLVVTWCCSCCRSPIPACISRVGWQRSDARLPAPGSGAQTAAPVDARGRRRTLKRTRTWKCSWMAAGRNINAHLRCRSTANYAWNNNNGDCEIHLRYLVTPDWWIGKNNDTKTGKCLQSLSHTLQGLIVHIAMLPFYWKVSSYAKYFV